MSDFQDWDDIYATGHRPHISISVTISECETINQILQTKTNDAQPKQVTLHRVPVNTIYKHTQ